MHIKFLNVHVYTDCAKWRQRVPCSFRRRFIRKNATNDKLISTSMHEAINFWCLLTKKNYNIGNIIFFNSSFEMFLSTTLSKIFILFLKAEFFIFFIFSLFHMCIFVITFYIFEVFLNWFFFLSIFYHFVSQHKLWWTNKI